MTHSNQQRNQAPAFFIGIDWADEKHDCYIIDRQGDGRACQLVQSPEAIQEWVAELTEQARGGTIAIMLEQSKGPLVNALVHRENVLLYPVNPHQLANYRKSYPGGRGKSDPTDARYLARLLRERINTLKPMLLDDEQTRLLASLCEERRLVVESKTKLRQQLIDALKQYFPQALQLFGRKHQLKLLLAMLQRWSDPRELRRADRQLIRRALIDQGLRDQERQQKIIDAIRSAVLLTRDNAIITPLAMRVQMLVRQIRHAIETIAAFDKKIEEVFRDHPDKELFSSLEGAGPILAPRLLCAFGSRRDRWENADQLASFSGIAPITKQSGKQRTVHRRFACPKYLRQTFHEFARAAAIWCPWSKARYRMLKDQGMKHNAAIRKIARSWIRILYRVWYSKKQFDSQRYLQTLRKRFPKIIPYLENQEIPQTT